MRRKLFVFEPRELSLQQWRWQHRQRMQMLWLVLGIVAAVMAVIGCVVFF